MAPSTAAAGTPSIGTHGDAVSVRSDIYKYLESLSASTLMRLYQNPASCLAVFRSLPSIAQQIVLRLVFTSLSIPESELIQWCHAEYESVHHDAVKRLKSLHILTAAKQDQWGLSQQFSVNFNRALTGGAPDASFGLAIESSHSDASFIAHLDRYATEQWESVLHYMLGKSSKVSVPKGVKSLLEHSGLMASQGDGTEPKITRKGFQFLLQDVNKQVWAFLIQYLEMAETKMKMDLVDVLNFLFQLGFMQLGVEYDTSPLSQTQLTLISDLKGFGIIYQNKDSGKFYPTRLATTLTSGSSPSLEKDSEGFIVIETNSRVYAYTDSPLHIAVLDLFLSLKYRFANFVVGILTRSSVKEALSKGITASQTTIIPATIVDQIYLWEQEQSRLNAMPGYFYQQFSTHQEYQQVREYAKEIGVLLYKNDATRHLVVSIEGHRPVREYFRKYIKGAAS